MHASRHLKQPTHFGSSRTASLPSIASASEGHTLTQRVQPTQASSLIWTMADVVNMAKNANDPTILCQALIWRSPGAATSAMRRAVRLTQPLAQPRRDAVGDLTLARAARQSLEQCLCAELGLQVRAW